MKKVNSLLIGVGYHAKRIYLPYIKNSKYCNLAACWDLMSQQKKIEVFLEGAGIVAPCYYTKNNSVSDTLNKEDICRLNEIVKKHGIESVIISTEPLAHLKYAKWALDNSLHILLDKPISTEIDVSINVSRARKLFKDYITLAKLYVKKNRKKKRRRKLKYRKCHLKTVVKLGMKD